MTKKITLVAPFYTTKVSQKYVAYLQENTRGEV